MLCERAPASVRWHRRTTPRQLRKCAPARSCCPHRPRKPLRWCSTAPQTLYARYPFNPSAPGRSGGTIWAPHCPPTPHLQSPQQRKLLPHTPHPSHRNGSRAPPRGSHGTQQASTLLFEHTRVVCGRPWCSLRGPPGVPSTGRWHTKPAQESTPKGCPKHQTLHEAFTHNAVGHPCSGERQEAPVESARQGGRRGNTVKQPSLRGDPAGEE